MNLSDLLQQQSEQRQQLIPGRERPDQMPYTPFQPPYALENPTPDQDPRMKRIGLLGLLSDQGGGGGGGGGMDMGGFTSGGDNPWGIDPNGMDLVTRHGVTLDRNAMRSLIQARRAGYNAFPFIGGGYRTEATSRAMLNSNNGLPHAQPGYSMHNYGLAFDAGSLPQDVRRYLTNHGWYWGNAFDDPPHYSYGRLG